MGYAYLPGIALDVSPFPEDRNLCSSGSAFGSYYQHLSYNPQVQHNDMSWCATQPTALDLMASEQASGQPRLSRVKMSQTGSNIGLDAGGYLSFQLPNIQSVNNQLNLPMDMMMANVSSDPFPPGRDVATHNQWMQMCSLSSDIYVKDAMPKLISEFPAQHPCMYSPPSDCVHEADSSGSSDWDGQLQSRSCFIVGATSDELKWRNSELLPDNFGGFVTGFSLAEKFTDHDESSSVVTNVDVETIRNSLGSTLVQSQGSQAVNCISLREPSSWRYPNDIELGNTAMVESVVNVRRANTQDPLPLTSSMQQPGNRPPSYKRQRAWYPLVNNVPVGPLSSGRAIVPSKLSRASSPSCPRSCDIDYPTPVLNVTNVHALCKDDQFSKSLTVPRPPQQVGYDIVANHGGFGNALRGNPDLGLRSHRKQNHVTSIEPQSVAARHRRKKITERVRVLEKLIPGGNKMDTASMLDESIEYVKFLQLQVQLFESLGDMSEGTSTTCHTSLRNESVNGKAKEFTKAAKGFGPNISQTCAGPEQVRPAASPLIVSEILQQQLFKHKLCLVSIGQCPIAEV